MPRRTPTERLIDELNADGSSDGNLAALVYDIRRQVERLYEVTIDHSRVTPEQHLQIRVMRTAVVGAHERLMELARGPVRGRRPPHTPAEIAVMHPDDPPLLHPRRCPRCGGSSYDPHARGRVICSVCGGAGFVPAT